MRLGRDVKTNAATNFAPHTQPISVSNSSPYRITDRGAFSIAVFAANSTPNDARTDSSAVAATHGRAVDGTDSRPNDETIAASHCCANSAANRRTHRDANGRAHRRTHFSTDHATHHNNDDRDDNDSHRDNAHDADNDNNDHVNRDHNDSDVHHSDVNVNSNNSAVLRSNGPRVSALRP